MNVKCTFLSLLITIACGKVVLSTPTISDNATVVTTDSLFFPFCIPSCFSGRYRDRVFTYTHKQKQIFHKICLINFPLFHQSYLYMYSIFKWKINKCRVVLINGVNAIYIKHYFCASVAWKMNSEKITNMYISIIKLHITLLRPKMHWLGNWIKHRACHFLPFLPAFAAKHAPDFKGIKMSGHIYSLSK